MADRAAATSAEPVHWLVRMPVGRRWMVCDSEEEAKGQAAAGDTIIPLYASPAPQVAALREERDGAKRREREALDAHNASFSALDQIRLLLNQDDLVDYENVVKEVASLSAALEAAKKDAERIAHVQAFPDEVMWCRGLLGGAGAWGTYAGNANGRGFTTRPTWREAVDVSLESLRAWAAVDPERFAAFPHLLAALPSGDATR